MTLRCIPATSLTSEAVLCRYPPGPGQNTLICRHVVSFSRAFAFTLYLALRRSYLALRPLTLYHLPCSSSPSAKRNLKPSPVAATFQQNAQYSASTELPSLQPAAPATTAGQQSHASVQSPTTPTANRKRKSVTLTQPLEQMASSAGGAEAEPSSAAAQITEVDASAQEPKTKKSRTNTPWTPAEELRLKQMRDAGNSWSEIAKVRKH